MPDNISPGIIPSTGCSTLRRFFQQGVTAADIAEGLVTFDVDHPAAGVRHQLRRLDFDVVGIRDHGVVVGYARREDLLGGICGDVLRGFPPESVVASHAPLSEVLPRVASHGYLFVTSFGVIAGILTSADLQKTPVRMWLFGLVNLIEETFASAIRQRFQDEKWADMLSPSRLDSARRLQNERRRRNESLDLLDCLQFADKGHIIGKDAQLREQIGMVSRSAVKTTVKALEQLRNRLAHAQDLDDSSSLETAVNLARHLDRVLDLTSPVHRQSRGRLYDDAISAELPSAQAREDLQ